MNKSKQQYLLGTDELGIKDLSFTSVKLCRGLMLGWQIGLHTEKMGNVSCSLR